MQLLRYEYSRVTWDKEKLKDAIAVDESLDVEAVLQGSRPPPRAPLAPTGRSGAKAGGAASSAARSEVDGAVAGGPYDLVSLIEHRGMGAHNGHYVGRMRNWLATRTSGSSGGGSVADAASSNSWWLFDDRDVTKTGLPAVLSSSDAVSGSGANGNGADQVVDLVEEARETGTGGGLESSDGGGSRYSDRGGKAAHGLKTHKKVTAGKWPSATDSLQSLGKSCNEKVGRPPPDAATADKGGSSKVANPSADVYILLYVGRQRLEKLQAQWGAADGAGRPAARGVGRSGPNPPEDVAAEVAARNHELGGALAARREALAVQRRLVAERLECHRELFGKGGRPPCVPEPGDSDFVLVDPAWLRQWVTGTAASAPQPPVLAGRAASGWVQCDACSKWRKLPRGRERLDSDLKGEWFCAMNDWDAARSECGAAQEKEEAANVTASLGVFCDDPGCFFDSGHRCEHGHVAPDTARTLKKLTKAALVRMLATTPTPGRRDPATVVAELVSGDVDAAYHFDCPDCRKAHRDGLAVAEDEAHHRAVVLAELGEAAPGGRAAATTADPDADPDADPGPGEFLVSRSWATAFKQLCERLAAGKEGKGATKLVKGNGGQTEITDFVPSADCVIVSSSSSCSSSFSSSSSSSSAPALDPLVNSRIKCSHGRLMFSGKGSQTRLISRRGWGSVVSLYPQAIEMRAQDRCLECRASSKETADAKKSDKMARVEHLSGCLGPLHRRKGNFNPSDFEPLLPAPVGRAAADEDSSSSSATPGRERWFIVRKSFLERWRGWVDGHGDAAPHLDGPKSLSAQLGCACGGGILMTKELEAVAGRAAGVPSRRSDNSNGHLFGVDGEGLEELELVAEEQFRELAARCPPLEAEACGAGGDGRGSRRDAVFVNDDGDAAAGGAETGAAAASAAAAEFGPEAGWVVLEAVEDAGAVDLRRFEWRPKGLCAACVGNVRASADAKRAAFTAGHIKIQRLNAGVPPPEPQEGTAASGSRCVHRTVRGALLLRQRGSSAVGLPLCVHHCSLLCRFSHHFSGAFFPLPRQSFPILHRDGVLCLRATCRPRRTGRSAEAAIVVSGVGSLDRVGLLKLKAWQVLGDLEPHRMELFHEGVLLADDDATLDHYRVMAGSTVHARLLAKSGFGGGCKRRGRPSLAGAVSAVDVDLDEGVGESAGGGPRKTLEDYFAYWGSERPNKGGAAESERGFTNTLLNRAFDAPVPSPRPRSDSEDSEVEAFAASLGKRALESAPAFDAPVPSPRPRSDSEDSEVEAFAASLGKRALESALASRHEGGAAAAAATAATTAVKLGDDAGAGSSGRGRRGRKELAKQAAKRQKQKTIVEVDDNDDCEVIEVGAPLWTCADCTFENNAEESACKMCQKPRDARTSPRRGPRR